MIRRERLFFLAIGNFSGAVLNIGMSFWLSSLGLPPYVQTFAAGFGCGVGFMCLAGWKDTEETASTVVTLWRYGSSLCVVCGALLNRRLSRVTGYCFSCRTERLWRVVNLPSPTGAAFRRLIVRASRYHAERW